MGSLPALFKLCRGCGYIKPRADFYARKRNGPNGLSSRCRECTKASERARRESSGDHVRTLQREKYQRTRDQVLAKQAAYALANAEKIAAYQKQYREARADERAAYQREYHKLHYARNREAYAERARERRAKLAGVGGTHTKADVEARYREQGGRCYWCGSPLGGEYEVDHVIPISRGGTNGPGNICCSCRFCNRSKGGKLPWEFSDRLF